MIPLYRHAPLQLPLVWLAYILGGWRGERGQGPGALCIKSLPELPAFLLPEGLSLPSAHPLDSSMPFHAR